MCFIRGRKPALGSVLSWRTSLSALQGYEEEAHWILWWNDMMTDQFAISHENKIKSTIYTWWIIKKCDILKNDVFMSWKHYFQRNVTQDQAELMIKNSSCWKSKHAFEVYTCVQWSPLGTCPLCPQRLCSSGSSLQLHFKITGFFLKYKIKLMPRNIM